MTRRCRWAALAGAVGPRGGRWSPPPLLPPPPARNYNLVWRRPNPARARLQPSPSPLRLPQCLMGGPSAGFATCIASDPVLPGEAASGSGTKRDREEEIAAAGAGDRVPQGLSLGRCRPVIVW